MDLATLTADARERILAKPGHMKGTAAYDMERAHPVPEAKRRKGDGKDMPEGVLKAREARDHQNLMIAAELAAINELLVEGKIEFVGQRQFKRIG